MNEWVGYTKKQRNDGRMGDANQQQTKKDHLPNQRARSMWMDGWFDYLLYGWIDRCMKELMDKWEDVWMNGWVEGC